MFSFIEYLENLKEVRYINPKSNNEIHIDSNEKPLFDNEKIRVFHGFYSFDDAVHIIKNGVSGKTTAQRVYSYEAKNNPNGLFVTIDPKISMNFSSSGVIIEFTTKISDLEAPIWVGGRSFFVQGEHVKEFKNMDEREQQKLINRKKYSKSPYEKISKSDRPELANTIFDNKEKQALYVGDLNSNMIKRVWYNETLHKQHLTTGEWKRLKPKEFINKFKNHKSNKLYIDKILKPNDDFSIDTIYSKFINDNGFSKNQSDKEKLSSLEELWTTIFSKYYQDNEQNISNLGFYPKQIKQIMDLYKSNKWKQELENFKNNFTELQTQ